MTLKRITVRVSHLRCSGSERYTVERALKAIPGVVEVYVNPVTELAYVDYDPAARHGEHSTPPLRHRAGERGAAKRCRKEPGDA